MEYNIFSVIFIVFSYLLRGHKTTCLYSIDVNTEISYFYVMKLTTKTGKQTHIACAVITQCVNEKFKIFGRVCRPQSSRCPRLRRNVKTIYYCIYRRTTDVESKKKHQSLNVCVNNVRRFPLYTQRPTTVGDSRTSDRMRNSLFSGQHTDGIWSVCPCDSSVLAAKQTLTRKLYSLKWKRKTIGNKYERGINNTCHLHRVIISVSITRIYYVEPSVTVNDLLWSYCH